MRGKCEPEPSFGMSRARKGNLADSGLSSLNNLGSEAYGLSLVAWYLDLG